MVIPGISIAYFAALSASLFPLILMCAGTLHRVICFPWLWSSSSLLHIWFNIEWLSLLFSMASISLIAIFIAVTSAVWIDASSGGSSFLQSLLSFLCSLISQCRLSCYYCDFLCIVRSAAFSRCHSRCVFLLHSRIICCLPTIVVAVSSSSLLSHLFFHITLFQSS